MVDEPHDGQVCYYSEIVTSVTADEATCAACGERLPVSARFCFSCGAPQAVSVGVELRKTVTLLFCDVTGSTMLGEQLDPEALRAVMGRFFAVASMAVQRHGGTVEKFVGDAVLAVFGIPEVREDDALRAVRAAFDMQSSLAELSAELMASMGVGLAVRTGVNTGSVVAGVARAGGSFATGDAVNTAARLEQAAAPGEVLLGALTWSLVRDAVEVEAVAPLTVKGKAEPLAAYRLVRVLAAERGHLRRLDAALVGRDRESAALADALARATEGARAQFVTVLGQAGMGKTRLVEYFLAGVGDGVAVLRGRCVSYGGGITFWPVVQLLRQAAGLGGEETAAVTEEALFAVLDIAPERAAIVERLLPLLGLGGEPGGVDETFWAVRAVLEHLASKGALVVVVDDIHWAEPTLLDLLERLRDETRDVPLLFVAQARPELLEARPGWGGGALNASTFLLAPLTGDHTAALLAGLLGAGVPGALVAAVQGWAGGNPLFVEEVAAHLVDNNVLARQDGAWVVVGDLANAAVPPTVTALLAARLDRLPAPEKSLLERISVIGLEASTADACALTDDENAVEVLSLLVSLSRRDLLRRGRGVEADTWAFRHVLLREASYDSLPKSVRADLHERFADRLQETSVDVGGETDAFVGYHLEQAVRFRRELSAGTDKVTALARRAADTLAKAAAHARDSDDGPAAIALILRAIAMDASAEKIARRRLVWRLARWQSEQGLVNDARQTLDQFADLMDETTTDLERASLAAELLKLRMFAAEDIDPRELRDAAATAAGLARQEHDRDRLVQALHAGADAAVMEGTWAQEADFLREIQEVGSPYDRRITTSMMGAVYLNGPAHVDEGLAYVATVRDLPGQSVSAQAIMLSGEATMLATAGQSERALELVHQSARLVQDLDDHLQFTPTLLAALVHLTRGDIATAIQGFSVGIAHLRRGGQLGPASTLLAWQAALLLEQGGSEDEARQVLEEAASVTSLYDYVSVALVETCRAVLAARGGDHPEGALRASKALAAIDIGDDIVQRANIRRWLSEVPARVGDTVEQRRLLTAARDLYRAKGHLPFLTATEQLIAGVPMK